MPFKQRNQPKINQEFINLNKWSVAKIMICHGIQNGRERVLHAKRENIPEGVVYLKGRICISEVYQQGGMSYIP